MGTAPRIETQAVRALRTALIGRRRPEVAVLARAVRGSTVAPAGSGKENTVAVPLGSKEHTLDAILSGPLAGAVVDQFVVFGLGGEAPAAAPIGAGGIIGRVAADVAHAAFPRLAIVLVIAALGACLAPCIIIAVARGTGCAHIAGRPLDTQTQIHPLVAGVRASIFWMISPVRAIFLQFAAGITLRMITPIITPFYKFPTIRTFRVIATILAILHHLAANGTQGMVAPVGTTLFQFAASRTFRMIPLVGTILLQFAADTTLRVLASVGTGIVLGATDPTAGLTRGMITAIRAIGFLLEALPAHRLLRTQTQRHQKEEAKAQ